jgi:2-polyprenyl-3-methyl-5-hydroxy-6-metoxy-1,4-benzoquinol methylase
MNAARYRLDIRYLHTEFDLHPISGADITASDGGCPVCGAAMKPLVAVEGRSGPVVTKDYCPACSYVQFRTLPSQSWIANYYASRWDTSRTRPKSLADDPNAYQNSIELLARHAPDRNSALFDLGAGYGVFLKRCQAEGYEQLTGIEASPRRAQRCVELGLAVSESTGETMADEPDVVARGPFDVVHSSHVVEHVYDLRATMSQVRRLLKPGGIAIVVVPNILSENMLVISQGIFHIRNFTPESLAHLFAVSGFEILEQNVGDGIEIVARMGDLPTEPPAPDAMGGARLLDGLAKRFAEELGVAPAGDGVPVEAGIFVSRPPRSARVWRGRRFPMLSKPGLLSLIFGAGFRELPVFGPQGRWLRLLNPRNLAFKLRRRLFGVGRLEIAAALRVDTPESDGSGSDAPALTIRFPAASVPILLK